MKKKVLVVDLDGTLYSINTFHYFIWFLFKYSIKNLKIELLMVIKVSTTLRGLKLISHAKMKYNILKSIKNDTKIDYNSFVQNLSENKRNINLIKDDSFDLKILATAAPLCYSDIIAKNEGFDYCIATKFPELNYTDDFENSKEIKMQNVQNYLSENNIDNIEVLITDHIDDLPLMKLSKHNIIVNPDSDLEKVLNANKISFEVYKE